MVGWRGRGGCVGLAGGGEYQVMKSDNNGLAVTPPLHTPGLKGDPLSPQTTKLPLSRCWSVSRSPRAKAQRRRQGRVGGGARETTRNNTRTARLSFCFP